MRVLGFGTYDTGRHPRIGVVLSGLREHGHTVEEVNEPVGFTTSERVEMLRHPWKGLAFLRRLIGKWTRLALRTRKEPGAYNPELLIVGYMGHFDVVLARILYPKRTIALDQMVFAADTAQDRGVAGGPALWTLRGLDRLAITSADIVLVDTEEHREMVPTERRKDVVVVPVGAAAEWFAAGTTRRYDRAPATCLRVVFYGLFTPLQGATVIARALRYLAAGTVEVTMIGTGQDVQAARAVAGDLPGVTWTDWVSPEVLPSLVAEHDVCLGIFGVSAKARRVVPNKVYQGAAAGCALVTSDTEPQRRALGDDALFVPPGEPEPLAEVLSRLASEPSLVQKMKSAARSRAERDFTPAAVVEPLVDFLKKDLC